MKHNNLIAIVVFLMTTIGYSQGLKFTFSNAVNTNDGTNDYYEADIMIETDGVADFKLGSGQIYFNYNVDAFGPNVNANSRIEITHPIPNYIIGQYINAAPANIYATPVINDNIDSRVSWSFYETFSSVTFNNNVTATPTKLIHIKLTYIDVLQTPNVAFVNDNAELPLAVDQFYTCCGSAGIGPFETIDCTNFPGTQFLGSDFDNTDSGLGSVLGVDDENLLNEDVVYVYPNPIKEHETTIKFNLPSNIEQLDILMYDYTGKIVKQYKNVSINSGANHISKPTVEAGLYFLQFSFNNGEQQATSKLIVE